jgi:tetratricopeptide (TPR) repeat protein/outer membrane protein OmpA-like peptidoglycan-associated protein
MNKRYILFIFIVVAQCSMLWGQTKKAFLEEAEFANAQKNYHGAMVYFNEALQFDKNDPAILYKCAEAARLYGAYNLAAKQYHYLMDTLKFDGKHELGYRLGEVYQSMGDYTKAKSYFERYLSEYSNEDKNLTISTRRNIIALDKALVLSITIDESVTITRMGDNVNSPDADFGASERNGSMYFSSLKFDGKSKETKNKQLAKTLVKNDQTIDVISGYINDRDQSVANFAFNTAGTKVYYSICEYVNGWTTSCQIYSSNIDNEGNLSNESKLGEAINAPGSSNSQPNIGVSETGNETLYFVSDRPGGKGGRDIWSSDTNSANTATNLKDINTIGDEITPFYHNTKGDFYFSTNGRDGLGGFDVHKYNMKTREVLILPPPTNSSRNDMYYYLDNGGYKGYLTSSRGSSLSQLDSYEACCMDIYSIDIASDIDLDVFTLLQTDGSNLNNTKVCLFDESNGKEECIINQLSSNLAKFKLKPNRNYRLVATKDGYTTATDAFKTNSTDKKLVKKLSLMPPAIKLEVRTFELPLRAKLDGATIKLIDITDPNKSIEIVKTNDLSNDFYYDLLLNRQYKVVASKNGYSSALEMIDTRGLTGTIFKELFLQKQGLQELLPISLYFDNDYPNPRSKSFKTNTVYNSLTDAYLDRKSAYITNFTKTMPDDDKSQATSEIESFFANDVVDGRSRFNTFLTQLEQRISSGEKIELELRGFASPRAKSEYNMILSARRIDCIKNQMMAFGSGIISNAFVNGSLKLNDVTLGNTTANSNVIGDLNDERNSIYNLNAARERRVEIINVIYK